MYTIRNKRGIGHVGGDVEANMVDAETCERLANWCICELIRIYHELPLEEAQAILNALAVRHLPNIWTVGTKKRVFDSSLDYKSQCQLLLHGELEGMVLVEELFEWVEHPRMSNFSRLMSVVESTLRSINSGDDRLVMYRLIGSIIRFELGSVIW